MRWLRIGVLSACVLAGPAAAQYLPSVAGSWACQTPSRWGGYCVSEMQLRFDGAYAEQQVCSGRIAVNSSGSWSQQGIFLVGNASTISCDSAHCIGPNFEAGSVPMQVNYDGSVSFGAKICTRQTSSGNFSTTLPSRSSPFTLEPTAREEKGFWSTLERMKRNLKSGRWGPLLEDAAKGAKSLR